MTSNEDQTPTTSESLFTVKKLEAAFLKSDEKTKLLGSLQPHRKDHGWNKKVENLAAKKLNGEVSLQDTAEFENYVENLTDFGLQTLPKTISSKIQEDVSKYVKKFSRPFIETYKEALFTAAEKNIDYLRKMKQESSSAAKVKYVPRAKPDNDKFTQIKPLGKEISVQTFPGLGNYNDHDFDTFVNNDNVELSYGDEEEFNSDDESGKMPQKEENILIEKLGKLHERQQQMDIDFKKAAEDYLELDERNWDHRQIIEKIKKLTEFEINIYDNSFAKTNDASLPPPTILTFAWKGKYFKLVTTSKWSYSHSTLSGEKRKRHIEETEEVYLYLPPPNVIPLKIKLDDLKQHDEYSVPTKTAKMDNPKYNQNMEPTKHLQDIISASDKEKNEIIVQFKKGNDDLLPKKQMFPSQRLS